MQNIYFCLVCNENSFSEEERKKSPVFPAYNVFENKINYFILDMVGYNQAVWVACRYTPTNESCFLSDSGSDQNEWYMYATP